MEFLKAINLAIRFLLEILVLIIVGYWGFHTANGTLTKIIFGIGIPIIIAVIWALFGAPKAPYTLTGLSFLLLEIIVFGLPVILLSIMGKQGLAGIYGIIAVVNLLLMKVWKQ